MAKQLSILDANFEDLKVLKHFARIYNMQCMGFFVCFVMKHFLHIYLLKNRSALQLILLQFVIFFSLLNCFLLMRIGMVNHNTRVREGTEKMLLEEATILF